MNRNSVSLLRAILPIWAVLVVSAATSAIEPPVVLDPNWKIELVTAEPELVTPVQCCFDPKGRLLVIESHTHFPPDDYSGPKTDQIHLFDDSDGDGTLDRQRLFYSGGTATMGLVPLPDGWIAVASRSQVIRIRDRDGDDVADEQQVLLELETEAEYPHNGLTGLALGPDGRLYVGQGENFGEYYELVAADGSTQTGSGEGGNIFRCTVEGEQLQRVATGFWNPFGLYFDSADRLWTVGNDPDAMPPCRLLHVFPGGDYGFQFRFGRAGTHPLQSWDGEFPGTLPMAAGTGEAPCAVVGVGDHLWVTSWGDNRVERYALRPRGASWESETEVLVQGDANFRPVGIAVAPDRSVYVTDWVDRSYPVHGKGRLWRLSRKDSAPPQDYRLPPRGDSEADAWHLMTDRAIGAAQRIDALDSDDPFVRQAAVTGLVDTDQLMSVDRVDVTSDRGRVGLLAAWRWKALCDPDGVPMQQRTDWIGWGLNDDSEEVVLAAIRWATEQGDDSQLPAIRQMLDRDDLSPRQFAAVMAAIAYLETGSAAGGTRDPAVESRLIQFASETSRPASLRAMAIRRIPAEAELPSDRQLVEWIRDEPDRKLEAEVVRLLAARSTPGSLKQLETVATDSSVAPQTRADAAAALAPSAGTFAATLNRLTASEQPQAVRQEAKRILEKSWRNAPRSRPSPEDLDAWEKLIGHGGDPDAGRRVFFRTTCANCHAHAGRGAGTGPDLTTLSGKMSRRRVLESILSPGKEVGPLYVPWRVVTVDGHVLTGLKLDRSGVGNQLRFQGADGMVFEVPLAEIEMQGPTSQSIMPSGLEATMTPAELRDLVAFLVDDPSDG